MPDEAATIRSYLQRCETRLSTLHRIAGVFLSGAGLLLLFPIFFKDAFLVITLELYKNYAAQRVVTLLLAVVAAISLFLPLYALYLLLKDLVLFYFTPHHFGTQEHRFYPRFILSGVMVPSDEIVERAELLRKARSDESIIRLLVPDADTIRTEIDAAARTSGYSIPPSGPDGDTKRAEILFNYTATTERTLPQEAAKMEVSLVKHILGLRILVLRYAKALLLFLVTFLLTMFMASLVNAIRQPTTASSNPFGLEIMSIFYVLWATVAAIAVRLPVRWIYRYADPRREKKQAAKDPNLVHFEKWAIALTAIACCSAVVSLLLNSLGSYRTFDYSFAALGLIVYAIVFSNALREWRH